MLRRPNWCEKYSARRTALFFQFVVLVSLGSDEFQHTHLTCHFVWRRLTAPLMSARKQVKLFNVVSLEPDAPTEKNETF